LLEPKRSPTFQIMPGFGYGKVGDRFRGDGHQAAIGDNYGKVQEKTSPQQPKSGLRTISPRKNQKGKLGSNQRDGCPLCVNVRAYNR
jgi:hypothetical protein